MAGQEAQPRVPPGGILTSGLSWRWVLFVNVPIGLGAAMLAPRTLVESRAEDGAAHDSRLLQGALAVKVRVQATVGGKKFDQTSYAVYQRVGDVLSGTYSFGANTPAQLTFALHAAEQSAKNLLSKHNVGSPTA